MRYYHSLVFIPLLLGLLSHPAVLATENEPPSEVFEPTQPEDFWLPAQKLVQEQLDLIAIIERALVSADPNRIRAARGRIILHSLAVDRTLDNYYSIPGFLCRSNANITNIPPVRTLSSEQVGVYCALYNSTQQLLAVAPLLEVRFSRLDDVVEDRPLPLITGERTTDRILGIPTVERGDLGTPATLRSSPMPDLLPAEPPLIGRIAKQPIADYRLPLPPAIAPLNQATNNLQAAKSILAQAQRNFPTEISFKQPEVTLIDERNPYEVYPPEREIHTQFLVLPNTGITRILPAQFYRDRPNTPQNRRLPTPAERFPFPPLLPEANGFTPRLGIQITDGNFEIVQRELNYGFMVDLGDVAIEDIEPKLENVSSEKQDFFLGYQPPNKLEALQIDRRRFITGKVDNFGLEEPLFSQAPVVLNHTYLVRSVQFQLPEVVVRGDRILRSQRRYLDLLLETPSADLLIAFRPVYRRLDGSYIVLWRVIDRFPNPQIQDLEKYLDLE